MGLKIQCDSVRGGPTKILGRPEVGLQTVIGAICNTEQRVGPETRARTSVKAHTRKDAGVKQRNDGLHRQASPPRSGPWIHAREGLEDEATNSSGEASAQE